MPVIEIDGLQKRYGENVAVADVSFTVERNEIFGILGPNGAGKTTTVECLEGLTKYDAGTIRVLGLDPHRDRAQVRRVLGAQLQQSDLPAKLRVREALKLYASFYEDPADIDGLLADLGLKEKRNSPFDSLSGGQAQRLSIALALVGKPEIAVLDELTTGLDPQARRDTWTLIEQVRDSGVTIVLVTHFMEEAERLCDRIAVIDSGRVAAIDTPRGLVARVSGGHQLLFTPPDQFDQRILEGLPGVDGVTIEGSTVVVSGAGDLMPTVHTALTDHGIAASGMHTRQATLDDAFTLLTGRTLGADIDGAPEKEAQL